MRTLHVSTWLCWLVCGVSVEARSKRKKWLTGELRFKRYPGNVHDANCVEVYYESKPGVWLKLGNVAREIAEWLSPLMMGPFHMSLSTASYSI